MLRFPEVERVPKFASIIAIVIGASCLLGWAAGLPVLTQLVPGLVTMKPNTGLCLVLLGVWVLGISLSKPGRPHPRILDLLPVAVAVISGLTLVEYALSLDLALDRALFPEAVVAEGFIYPGRMSPVTAVLFVLLAGAVVLDRSRKPRSLVQAACAATLLAALIGLIGYLYGVTSFSGPLQTTPLALHTAVAFILLAFGILALRPSEGAMALVRSSTPGGALARRMLPAAILLPVIIGWVRLHGELAGLYDTRFGIGLFCSSLIALFVALILWTSRSVDRIEEKKQAVETQFRLLVEGVQGYSIIMVNRAGIVTSWNEGAARIFGYSAEEIVGRHLSRLYPGEARYDGTVERLLEMAEKDGSVAGEGWRLRKNGSKLWGSAVVTRLHDDQGQTTGYVSILRDVTEQRQAQEALRISERRYRSILDQATFSVQTFSPDGECIHANPAWEKLWESSLSELAGYNVLTDPQINATELGPLIHRVFAGEALAVPPICYDPAKIGKIGRRRWVEGVMYPVKEADSSVREVVLVLGDITERRAAEEELKASEARLWGLLEVAPDCMLVVDRDGLITFANPRTSAVFGFSPQELVGQPVDMLVPERFRKGHMQHRSMYREQPYPRQMGAGQELYAVRKDGTEFPAEISLGPLHRGGELYVLTLVRDITERKRGEEAQRRFTAILEQNNRELQDFAFIASHDLQEPLRKIQTFGGRLRAKYSDVLKDEGADYLQRILNASTRMQRLIEDLLSFSRVSTRAQSMVRVELSKVLQEVLEDLEARVEQTGGRVTVDPLPTIDADPTQMRQLFMNLIGNALKFHRLDVPPIVTIHGEPVHAQRGPIDHGMYRITVSDNGIGFENQYADRIFTPFQRLHGRDEYEGTGIGLPICRKIVGRHGGTITAESTPGAGSVFTVILPLRQAHYDQGGHEWKPSEPQLTS